MPPGGGEHFEAPSTRTKRVLSSLTVSVRFFNLSEQHGRTRRQAPETLSTLCRRLYAFCAEDRSKPSCRASVQRQLAGAACFQSPPRSSPRDAVLPVPHGVPAQPPRHRGPAPGAPPHAAANMDTIFRRELGDKATPRRQTRHFPSQLLTTFITRFIIFFFFL